MTMDPTDPLWYAQQLVETLQHEVAVKEAELALLIKHRAKLLLAFSTPTFPLGYTHSASILAEDSKRLDDRSKTSPGLRLDVPGPSGRHSTPKIARSPVVNLTVTPLHQRSPRHPPISRMQGSGSDSETSDDSLHTPTTTKDHGRDQPTRQRRVVLDAVVRDVPSRSCDSGEISETSEDDVQPSPANKKIKYSPDFPVVNWTQQIKKRTATSVHGDSSTDTDDSMSGDAPEDEGLSRNIKVIDPGKTRTSEDRTLKATVQAQTLSSDASLEDKFDWEVLGISGPWSTDPSLSVIADSSWSQLHKQQSPLPCKFKTMDEYKSSFEGLIFEECKAHLNSAWDILKVQAAETDQSVAEILGLPEDRCQSTVWQFRPMYPSSDDPFKYIEAEQVEGLKIRLDPSEVVLLTHNSEELLAVVTVTNYKGVLLRTRMELPAAGGQFELLRMTNMVTLKREYVSLCRATDIWDPLQQQLLNPLEGSNFVISCSSDSYQEETLKATSSVRVSAWRKQRLLNRKQRSVVECLLRLHQGFLLVQGPPGTGKTSTIVGMVSAVRIEEPRARILVCASSNAAVDEIVSRLMHQMYNQHGKLYTPRRGTLVRLGVEKSIQPACRPVSLDKFVQSNTSASNFGTIKRDTIAAAFIVCCTISGSGHQIFDEIDKKFDVLIIGLGQSFESTSSRYLFYNLKRTVRTIADRCCLLFVGVCVAAAIVPLYPMEQSTDEAAQAQESEVLIALQRVKGRCVMVGDPCQLPSVVLQRPGKAYGRSLFERMHEAGRHVVLMTTQYRMHPLISKFPSATFYAGRLIDSPQSRSMRPIFKKNSQDKAIDICGYSFKLGAYCFLDVTWGVEQEEVVGHSISNVDEAEVVATVVQGVVRSLKDGLSPNIGVITPYLAQRSAIKRNLEKHGIDEDACEVDTVDGFQGREKDVIILSCVRAHSEHGLGFVSDVRRMNVALTRARHSLIIVGHAETLRRQSQSWNALVEDAIARGLYQILCHNSKTNKETGLKDAAGGRQADVVAHGRPQYPNHTRFEQRPTAARTDHGLLSTPKRFEQKTHVAGEVLQQPTHTSAEPGPNSASATGRDKDQPKFESQAATANEPEQRASDARVEVDGEGYVNTSNSKPSIQANTKRPLSVICGTAMGPRSSGITLKRKAGQGGSVSGHDQAEGSNAKRRNRIEVKPEEEDGFRTRNFASRVIFTGMPAAGFSRQAPAHTSDAPVVERMRGQMVDGGWNRPGWHDSPSLGTTNVKKEMQEGIPLRQHPCNNRESWSDEPLRCNDISWDDGTTAQFSEVRGSFPKGRGRGRGRALHRGSGRSNYKGNWTENNLGKEQNGSSRLGNGIERTQSARGWHRGRGTFNRSFAR